jgi:hypothetical protein
MVIDMNGESLQTLARMQAFLDSTVSVAFAVAVEERYDFTSPKDRTHCVLQSRTNYLFRTLFPLFAGSKKGLGLN